MSNSMSSLPEKEIPIAITPELHEIRHNIHVLYCTLFLIYSLDSVDIFKVDNYTVVNFGVGILGVDILGGTLSNLPAKSSKFDDILITS